MYRLVVIDDEYIVVQGIKALLSRLKLGRNARGLFAKAPHRR